MDERGAFERDREPLPPAARGGRGFVPARLRVGDTQHNLPQSIKELAFELGGHLCGIGAAMQMAAAAAKIVDADHSVLAGIRAAHGTSLWMTASRR